jgi:hypothetical protein
VVFAFLIPTCPRWTSDFDTNAHHRRLFTAAAWRGLEPAPGSGLRRAFLHLSCSLCTIGQFIANLPFLRLRRTPDGPVVPDGAREGCRGQHNGRGVKGGFLASRPGSGRGGADQGAAADAHEGRDIAGEIAAGSASWPDKLVRDLAGDLFPGVISVSALVALLERTTELKSTVSGFGRAMREIVEKIDPWSEQGVELRNRMAELVWGGRDAKKNGTRSEGVTIISRRRWRASLIVSSRRPRRYTTQQLRRSSGTWTGRRAT